MLIILRDQELRFTVHESPDYYQLKVSVFNDDKKTELIGETWVALGAIVIPGGGKNDIWHNLNCKGKYAGEIRIELTYYDTRPREDKAEEHRASAPIDGFPVSGREGLSGPRQPKPVKRRPLPADPTGSNGSSPMPYTPPNSSLPGTPQRYVESPDDFAFEQTPPQHNQLQSLQQHSPSRGSPLNPYNNPQALYDESLDTAPMNHYPSPEQFGQRGPGIHAYGQQNLMVLSQSPHADQYLEQSSPYDPSYELPSIPPSGRYASGNQRAMPADPRDNIDPRLLGQPQRLNMVQSNSSPAVVDRNGYPRSPVSKSNSYDNSPTHRPQRGKSGDPWPSADDEMMQDDGPPPPPPTHRHSGSRSAQPSPGVGGQDPYGPVPATAPLNLRNDRGSFSNSPLYQVHTTAPSTVSALSASPSREQAFLNHHGSVSSLGSYGHPNHRRSVSPVRDYGESMPPSLMPGYEPSIAADESERILRERQMIGQQASQGPMPRYEQAAAVPIQQPRAQPIPRGFENLENRRAHREHRYSAPVAAPMARPQPQPVTRDPRTPMRKSVSPQPSSGPSERRHSELASQTPFGPDSYDAFNPAISSANSVNDTGARYSTPNEAREATFQHDKQSRLGDGPIIGSDGRIIDPSDHLPTDTWAPEPEQKPVRKGPEVTIRFRHSPQGAQPVSQAGRRPLAEARPNAVSSPTYPQSANSSPASAARTRLQKKSGQPNSSPAVPRLHTSPRTGISRSSTSDHPLRENENYGYGNNSPSYGNRSPGGMPPPLPGKIPIGSGQEDWGMSALSEEMRMIDIGVGAGGRGQERATRSRFGVRDV